jgi:pimeloyl-ACP methyl ester carboxylesterase
MDPSAKRGLAAESAIDLGGDHVEAGDEGDQVSDHETGREGLDDPHRGEAAGSDANAPGGARTVRHDPSRISRAVLANPAGIIPISLIGLLRVIPALLASGVFPSRERARRSLRRLLGPDSLIDEELLEFFEIAMEPGRIPADNMRAPAVPARSLTGFRSPTLVITGARDLFFPALAIGRQVPRTLPTARVHVIEGMNHMPGSREIDEMNALFLNFLGSTEARAPSANANAGAGVA